MKTAIASSDGPDKKKFGIPKKDKKGLAKKTEYEYQSKTMDKKKKPKPKLKGDSEMPKGDPSKRERDLSLNKPPKSREEERNISKQRTKGIKEDSQFEKSYKVVPNKLKTKEDLNKKDSPSTKKGKK
jgi:hypothetical protein